MKRVLYLTTLSIVAGLILAPTAMAQSSGPSGADGTYICEDFDEQGQAQEAFNRGVDGNPVYNPNVLDDDGDGIACESLPTAIDPNAPGAGIDQYTITEETTEGTTGEQTVSEQIVSEQIVTEETAKETAETVGGTDEEKTRRERREKQEQTGGEGTGGGVGETTTPGGTTGSQGGSGGSSSDNNGGGASQGGLALAINDSLGNISRGRLPSTGGGWAVLLVAGAALIGGGWLLVRRFGGDIN